MINPRHGSEPALPDWLRRAILARLGSDQCAPSSNQRDKSARSAAYSQSETVIVSQGHRPAPSRGSVDVCAQREKDDRTGIAADWMTLLTG